MPSNCANRISSLPCILHTLSLLLLLNLSACFCKQETLSPVATIGMEIATTHLIADQKEIKVHFSLGNLSLLDSYQLRITTIEEKVMPGKDVVEKTQLTYKDATGSLQTFFTPYTAALTALISSSNLVAGGKPHVNFNLLPAEQVMKLKLQFELMQVMEVDKPHVVNSIVVEWILKGLIFNILTNEQGSYFTLQNLQGDIKDLNQLTASIQSVQGSVSFDVNGIAKTQATLAELLPTTQMIAKDQETPPIKLILNSSLQDPAQKDLFSIVVLPKENNNTSKGQEKQTIPAGALDPQIKATIEETVKELFKLQEASKDDDIEDPAYLEELENILDTETQHLENPEIEEAEVSIQENKKKALEELELQNQQELEGKSPAEQKEINKKYQQQKRKIVGDAIKQSLKNRWEHIKGSFNALGHDFFFVKSQNPGNPSYEAGQETGHKAAVVIASVLAALGSGLIGVGVFVGTAGAPVTLGTIEAVAIPTIGFGALFVAYSIVVTLRAQKKLSGSDQEHATNIEKGLVGRYIKLLDKIKAAREKRKNKKAAPVTG